MRGGLFCVLGTASAPVVVLVEYTKYSSSACLGTPSTQLCITTFAYDCLNLNMLFETFLIAGGKGGGVGVGVRFSTHCFIDGFSVEECVLKCLLQIDVICQLTKIWLLPICTDSHVLLT